MAWFIRKGAGITTRTPVKSAVPDGYWLNCPKCKAIISRREWEDNVRICPKCAHPILFRGKDPALVIHAKELTIDREAVAKKARYDRAMRNAGILE